jgi:hypothetical protein
MHSFIISYSHIYFADFFLLFFVAVKLFNVCNMSWQIIPELIFPEALAMISDLEVIMRILMD